MHFQDGTHLDLTSDLRQLHEQVDAIEPSAFSDLLRFLSAGYQHYHGSVDRFVGRNFRSAREFFSLPNLPLLFQLRALTSQAAHLGRFVRDPRLRAAFSFQDMYLGLSSSGAMATYSLLQYTELVEGVWFRRGGMASVISSLVALAEGQGVRFRFRAPVRAMTVEGRRATGVVLDDGERVAADVVVANADLPDLYAALLPPDTMTLRLARMCYTSSALLFSWASVPRRTPRCSTTTSF